MDSKNKTARLAGLLYMIVVVTGIVTLIVPLMYFPSPMGGHGDPSAIISHIIHHETLYRVNIAIGTLGNVAFLLLPLVLYALLASVQKPAAVMMVTLLVISMPIVFLATANQFDILTVLNGAGYHKLITSGELHARIMFLTDASNDKVAVASLFWGLWLFPFGYLVFKSNFLPKVLGVFLVLGGIYWVIAYCGSLFDFSMPFYALIPDIIGEVGIALWLLIVGARRTLRSPPIPTQ